MKILLNNKKGFSLVELMVTLVIFSIIILGLVTFFGGGVRAWITGYNQLRSQREARMAMDMMVKEMREGESATLNSSQSITIDIPALGTDPAYSVTFSWGGAPGNPLNRSVGGTPNVMLDNVSLLTFDRTGNRVDMILEMDLDDDSHPDISLNTDVFLRNS